MDESISLNPQQLNLVLVKILDLDDDLKDRRFPEVTVLLLVTDPQPMIVPPWPRVRSLPGSSELQGRHAGVTLDPVTES